MLIESRPFRTSIFHQQRYLPFGFVSVCCTVEGWECHFDAPKTAGIAEVPLVDWQRNPAHHMAPEGRIDGRERYLRGAAEIDQSADRSWKTEVDVDEGCRVASEVRCEIYPHSADEMEVMVDRAWGVEFDVDDEGNCGHRDADFDQHDRQPAPPQRQLFALSIAYYSAGSAPRLPALRTPGFANEMGLSVADRPIRGGARFHYSRTKVGEDAVVVAGRFVPAAARAFYSASWRSSSLPRRHRERNHVEA